MRVQTYMCPLVAALLAVVLTYVGGVVGGVALYRRVCHVTLCLIQCSLYSVDLCAQAIYSLLGIETTDL